MRIFHSVTWNVPFVYLSIGYAIKNLSTYLKNIEITLWDYFDFKSRKIEPYPDDCILIFEAGNIPHGQWTIAELKQWFPKGKIIALYSDTNWFIVNNQLQIPDGHLIDLHLDLNLNCIDWMQRKGWLVDQWLWTCSDTNIKELKQICPQDNINWQEKKYDLIGVYHPYTLLKRDRPCSNYRHDMVEFLQRNRISFTQGGGKGHEDQDVNKIYKSYQQSYLNLGTSSHGHELLTELGTLKGWREWISPFLNCLLIHDDHPQVQKAYNKENIIPTYRYNNFHEIKELVYFYKNNLSIFHNKLLLQREWAEDNTLDKQLVKLLSKYNFISQDHVR